jgi:NAD(P)-dependent dehydrogenase (short-subunit alcohol dehydrogenase family)
MKRLENKVVVITGGSGSIGKVTAKLLLEEGAYVYLVDLDEQSLKDQKEELNSTRVQYCAADVSKAEEVKRYVAGAVQAFEKIDVFFNNAGIEGTVKPLVDYPDDVFDHVLAVNVRGMWLGNKNVLPHMNDGGSIIMTSSVAGIVGFAGLGAYSVSKHAAVGIMRVSALEAAPRQIRVNSIHPSPVNNRMMRSIEEGVAEAGKAEDAKKQFESIIPLGRYAEPIEIAQLVLFLASDESQFITGTTQVIDGGLLVQ